MHAITYGLDLMHLLRKFNKLGPNYIRNFFIRSRTKGPNRPNSKEEVTKTIKVDAAVKQRQHPL